MINQTTRMNKSIAEYLERNPIAILAEIFIVFAPFYAGLVISDRLDLNKISLGGDLAILGGYPSYLGLLISAVLLWSISKLRGSGWAEMGVSNPGIWWLTILKSLAVALSVLGAVVLLINPILNSIPNLEPRDMSRFHILEGNIPNLLINLVLMWITAGFIEELYWRGYLLNRLRDMFNSSTMFTWIQVIMLSSMIFGLGHNYQGMYGVLKTGAIGLIFSLAYLAVGKNIWPLVIAHALIDSLDFITHFFGGNL